MSFSGIHSRPVSLQVQVTSAKQESAPQTGSWCGMPALPGYQVDVSARRIHGYGPL